MKLNLGCGTDVKAGWVNLDLFPLKGVDVVHDLKNFPWPFKDDSVEEIIMVHIIEHLPDTVKVMEEVWRIMKDGGLLNITLPYWNSEDFLTDPTHIKMFGNKTFEFFDPSSSYYQKRSYYTKAKFKIVKKSYTTCILNRYLKVPPTLSRAFEILSMFFGNVIQVMDIELAAVK